MNHFALRRFFFQHHFQRKATIGPVSSTCCTSTYYVKLIFWSQTIKWAADKILYYIMLTIIRTFNVFFCFACASIFFCIASTDFIWHLWLTSFSQWNAQKIADFIFAAVHTSAVSSELCVALIILYEWRALLLQHSSEHYRLKTA